MATIQEGVKDELVFIGTALGGDGLRFAIGKRIDNPGRYLGGAEKAAVECGRSLEVSWAPTSTPEAHKAALVLAYEEEHNGVRPGFERFDTGEWVPGINLLLLKHGEANSDLVWSPWMPMNDGTISRTPEELGVYRVRAVPAGSAVPTMRGSESERHQQEQQEHPEHGSMGKTATLTEFIPKVLELRHKYLNSPRELAKPKHALEIEDEIQKKAAGGSLDKIDIETIVYWGRGFRLLGQVRKNSNEYIRNCTADAINALDKKKPTEALDHINRIHGLRDAFGSKVLAFLRPQICPVWDAVVKDCLSEAASPPRDYREFITLCEYIRSKLKADGPANPRGTGEDWYLRDIEMAIFRFAWGPNRKRTKGRYLIELPLFS